MARSSPSVQSRFSPSPPSRGKKTFNFGPFGKGGRGPKGVSFHDVKMKKKMERGECSKRRERTTIDVMKRMKKESLSTTPVADMSAFEGKGKEKANVNGNVRRGLSFGPAEAEMLSKMGGATKGEWSLSVQKSVQYRSSTSEGAFIKVRVRSDAPIYDEGVEYSVHHTSTFNHIYHHYASLIDVHPWSIVLKRGDSVVNPHSTAAKANVHDGDVLIVCGKDSSVNTNRNVKMVTFKQCHNFPIELTVPAPVTQSLSDLWAIWARFMNLEQGEFYLVRNEFIISPVGTVSWNKLRNGDKLYCIRYRKSGTTSSSF